MNISFPYLSLHRLSLTIYVYILRAIFFSFVLFNKFRKTIFFFFEKRGKKKKKVAVISIFAAAQMVALISRVRGNNSLLFIDTCTVHGFHKIYSYYYRIPGACNFSFPLHCPLPFFFLSACLAFLCVCTLGCNLS